MPAIYHDACRRQRSGLAGRKARKFARRYDWANIVDRMMVVYEEVVAEELVIE